MRYGYSNPEVSLVNRAYNTLKYEFTVPDGKGSGLVDLSYDTPGVLDIVAGMWFRADKAADWSAEGDVALDLYPALKSSWDLDPDDNVQAKFDEAMDLACSFENRLWLAECVAGALLVLEADNTPTWSEERLARLNIEFKLDRDDIAKKIADLCPV